ATGYADHNRRRRVAHPGPTAMDGPHSRSRSPAWPRLKLYRRRTGWRSTPRNPFAVRPGRPAEGSPRFRRAGGLAGAAPPRHIEPPAHDRPFPPLVLPWSRSIAPGPGRPSDRPGTPPKMAVRLESTPRPRAELAAAKRGAPKRLWSAGNGKT